MLFSGQGESKNTFLMKVLLPNGNNDFGVVKQKSPCKTILAPLIQVQV
jgi:hypothetical protein